MKYESSLFLTNMIVFIVQINIRRIEIDDRRQIRVIIHREIDIINILQIISCLIDIQNKN